MQRERVGEGAAQGAAEAEIEQQLRDFGAEASERPRARRGGRVLPRHGRVSSMVASPESATAARPRSAARDPRLRSRELRHRRRVFSTSDAQCATRSSRDPRHAVTLRSRMRPRSASWRRAARTLERWRRACCVRAAVQIASMAAIIGSRPARPTGPSGARVGFSSRYLAAPAPPPRPSRPWRRPPSQLVRPEYGDARRGARRTFEQ